jgi:hypothetical protein
VNPAFQKIIKSLTTTYKTAKRGRLVKNDCRRKNENLLDAQTYVKVRKDALNIFLAKANWKRGNALSRYPQKP